MPEQTYGAFELKFVLRDEIVDSVIEWARANLSPDPYAGVGDVYEVNSLYFDSDDLNVFHRSDGFNERKYRVRRYGTEGLVYLEEKEKLKGWVRKRRTPVASSDLDRIETFDATWPGAWFGETARNLGLSPRSQVAYRRIARIGEAEGKPIRLTIDRLVRCASACDLALPALPEGLPIERSILELKFGRNGLPVLYKRLIGEFGLEPDASSKYRLSIEATGLAFDRVAA